MVLGLLLWFIWANNDPVTVAFPFGLGKLQSTTGRVIPAEPLIASSSATALLLTASPTPGGGFKAARRRNQDAEGRELDEDRPPPDYAAKASGATGNGRELALTGADALTSRSPRSARSSHVPCSTRMARRRSPRRDVGLRAIRLDALAAASAVGSLKTGLSHLEFENQQLKKQVANLKEENRDIENRLVQEETSNGDLSGAARRRLGQAPPPAARSGRVRRQRGSTPPRRTDLPARAGRPVRSGKRRSHRFPARSRSCPPPMTRRRPLGSAVRTAIDPIGEDPGPTSSVDRPYVWLPVASRR